ncbi:MAG: cyclic nucleotide-binding domain-containing protein [Alphaproteobacteria bacterium]
MTERRFAAGEIIFREGESADVAYLIHSGRVEIVKETAFGPTRLALLGEGDLLGEMGVLESAPRSATARAQIPVVASTIDQNAFLAMLLCRPRDSLAVLRSLFQRLRRMNQRVAALASPAATGTRTVRVVIHTAGRPDRDGAAAAFESLELEVGPDGVVLRDLGNRNGVEVNGVAIGAVSDWVPLREGVNEVNAGEGSPQLRIVVESSDDDPPAPVTRH